MSVLVFNIVCLVFGAWNIAMGMIMNTKNWYSAVYFKVIPFIGGTYLFIYTIRAMGLI